MSPQWRDGPSKITTSAPQGCLSKPTARDGGVDVADLHAGAGPSPGRRFDHTVANIEGGETLVQLAHQPCARGQDHDP